MYGAGDSLMFETMDRESVKHVADAGGLESDGRGGQGSGVNFVLARPCLLKGGMGSCPTFRLRELLHSSMPPNGKCDETNPVISN